MPTFVCISNAEDGEIATYLLTSAGELVPRGRTRVAAAVMPLAISPDRRHLYAAVRSKPFSVHAFLLDPSSGAPGSYWGHLISVNEVASDGTVAAEPRQVIHVGRHTHAILADRTTASCTS